MVNLQPFFLVSVVMWIYYILELIGVSVWAMMLVTNAYASYVSQVKMVRYMWFCSQLKPSNTYIKGGLDYI